MTTTDDTLRVLRRTRQTRHLAGEPISDEALHEILDVARWTGSASNKQEWRFVVVRDRETLRRLAGDKRPGIWPTAGAGAAIAIVMPGESATRDTYDEARVAERVLVAATALGLAAAIGWVRDEYRDEVKDILGVPAERQLRTIVSVGVPTEEGRKLKSPPGEARLPLDEVVRWERWSP